ncbi:MAG TPA: glycosyltransferase [Stellaceae bacterium]|jgi:GT2 family glycosyltransferase
MSPSDPSDSPGVSFVVPVYNKRPFLTAMVEGLARQGGDFAREIIFVDDGSTDGSGAALAKLTARWDHVRILTRPNGGPSLATNMGLAAAQFPLIKLVDADDVLLPGVTAMLRAAMLSHPGAVLAFGGAETYRSRDEALARLRDPAAEAPSSAAPFDALPGLLRRCEINPSLCLISAAAAKRVGGCDERVFTQDYSLFLRLAAQGTFIDVGAPVALCAAEAPGRINDGGPQVLHDVNAALLHFLRETPVPRRMARAAVYRGLRRAWRWTIRREGRRLVNPALFRLALAYLSFPWTPLRLLRQSCAGFALSRKVRIPEA